MRLWDALQYAVNYPNKYVVGALHATDHPLRVENLDDITIDHDLYLASHWAQAII